MRQGNKIKLRDWELDDLIHYRHWNLGRHEWMDYDGPYYPKLTEEKLEARIKRIEQKIATNNWGVPRERLVIADTLNNELIGTVNWYWQSKETKWKSIGIVIYNERYWGKGIGFEALKLWITYLFEVDQEIIRLDLRTWLGNQGMIRLAEKLGFVLEAIFRKARIVNEVYFDSIGMGILREEWEENI